MIKYTTKVIDNFPETITTTFATPAADHLFTVRNKQEAKFLPKQQAQAFDHTVLQLLFLCKGTQYNIQMAISFLTTHVKRPNKDVWGKHKQVVIQYLCGAAEQDTSKGGRVYEWSARQHCETILFPKDTGILSATKLYD